MMKDRKKELESHAQVLRGLINYHKRMVMISTCTENENKECPKATFMNDVYLGALEESLKLIEREISGQIPIPTGNITIYDVSSLSTKQKDAIVAITEYFLKASKEGE